MIRIKRRFFVVGAPGGARLWRGPFQPALSGSLVMPVKEGLQEVDIESNVIANEVKQSQGIAASLRSSQ